MGGYIYYNGCPKCGNTFRFRVRPNAFRLGQETSVCVCGMPYWSGKREWAHLSGAEKRRYFLSEGAVGIILMFPLLAGILVGVPWGVIIGLLSVGPPWVGKWLKVRASLKRCPE